MLGRYRNSFAEINLPALEQNFLALKKQAGDSSLAPMVKADAYGHGDVHVAKICERLGARYLGVALIEEGIKLRLAGIQMPILLFGFFDSIGAEAIVKYRITPVLSDFAQIERLKSVLHEGAAFPVHAKFNTGMQRLGFEPESAGAVSEEFSLENFLKLEGLCTHLISSEDAGVKNGRSDEQEKLFAAIQKTLRAKVQSPIISHVSNSAGILARSHSKYEAVRPGLSLYGVIPKMEDSAKEKFAGGFQPVLSLRSQIVHLHQVKKGATVSYSGTWTALKNSQVAVIPLGYADGIPRALSNKGEVLIHGQFCPMIGTVCMDYFMVDVTELKEQAGLGDEVVIIGKQKKNSIHADQLAEKAGTIAYEILTGLQARVPRIFIH